jgi:hypothetical protein
MKPIGLLVVLVGCGAKPAEPLSTPAITPPAEVAPGTPGTPGAIVGFARPTIDVANYLPDVTESGRWPLGMSEHPSLEPHFDIAAALADPGISWTDLCVRGAQHRHMSSKQDLVDYLDAWCSVAKDDLPTAIVKLGSAHRAATVGVLQALKLDVASIAAAHGSAHDLESFLRSGGFLDVDQVDLVAAAYYEVGALDDALEANQLAASMDYNAHEALRCKRMLRAIADTSGSARDDAVAELKDIAIPRRGPDQQAIPHCADAYAEVQCWRDDDCASYWGTKWRGPSGAARDESADLKRLLVSYRAWPATPQTGTTWLSIAQQLEETWPPRDKFELLIPALDLAVRASMCDSRLVGAIDKYAAFVDADLDGHSIVQYAGRPLGIRQADRAPEAAGQLDAATAHTIRDHLALVRAQAKLLQPAITSECAQRIAQLPPMPRNASE